MNINEANLEQILNILEPYFKKKINKEFSTGKSMKTINAIIKKINSLDLSKITVATVDSPDIEFTVVNPNLHNIYHEGDMVQLLYYDSLKTAKIFAKLN